MLKKAAPVWGGRSLTEVRLFCRIVENLAIEVGIRRLGLSYESIHRLVWSVEPKCCLRFARETPLHDPGD